MRISYTAGSYCYHLRQERRALNSNVPYSPVLSLTKGRGARVAITLFACPAFACSE